MDAEAEWQQVIADVKQGGPQGRSQLIRYYLTLVLNDDASQDNVLDFLVDLMSEEDQKRVAHALRLIVFE